MTVKYLLKHKNHGYLVDEEWDGNSYTKTPYFMNYFSYDTKEEAYSYGRRLGLEPVAIKQTVFTHPSHTPYKRITTPKGKTILRCSRCNLGTKARPSFDIALKEYDKLKQEVSCSIYSYTEINSVGDT